MSSWRKRTGEKARMLIVSVRLHWISFLVWIMPLLPRSDRVAIGYTAWVSGMLRRTIEFSEIPALTYLEERKLLDQAYAGRGITLRWVHPGTVPNGFITTRTQVQEGTVVEGNQGPNECFAYLEPHPPKTPVTVPS